MDKFSIANAAVEIQKMIRLGLAGKLDENNIDDALSCMQSIPEDVYRNEIVLSFSISGLRKYIGDADIRERDAQYDDYRRNELKQYLFEIDQIIQKYS